MTDSKLTQEDVKRLLSDPSGAARAATAEKIAQQFDTTNLSDHEREIAEEIFRVMLKDAEVRVREALAVNLKANPMVPHDVAKSLAEDVDEVALPILQFSEVLSQEDLVSLIQSHDPEKQKAIASRSHVDSAVADALVDEGNEEVVATLVSNEGAELEEDTLGKVVEKFGDSEAVQAPLVNRPKLPVTIVERLVTRVSEQLQDQLIATQDLPADMAADLLLQSRERATIGLSTESTEDEVEALVTSMRQNERLTPSIIIRAVCMGDIKFFEYAMATYAGIPVVNARTLIHDEGDLGLKGLASKAGFTEAMFPAIRAAIDVARETDYDGEENDRERYSRRMIERVLTHYGDLGVEFESDDLEYLLAKMSNLPANVAASA